MPRAAPFVLLVLLAAPAARAQRVVVGADSLARLARFSDTLNVATLPPYRLRPFVRPGSVVVKANGALLPASAYTLDAAGGGLTLGVGAPFPLLQLVVSYETWGAGSRQVASIVRDRPRAARTDGADSLGFTFRDLGAPSAPAVEPGLTLRRSGSISRGVIAGSNQEVTLESGLRLSVDGEVAPGVRVEASLTDANTPLLAEGTTQRLSEFDRLYITVTTKGTQARLGDVDLNLAGGELVRLSRRVQGGAFDLRLGPMLGGLVQGASASVVGAVPRGQFRQQEFAVVEGVQGPYRLLGASGEPFILVVPGSEAVYLDGQRLVRDRDADYTIEYATGEITFTPRRLLRAEQRLVVEFQYTANLFARSLTGGRAAVDLRLGRRPLAVGATLLREADGLRVAEGLDLAPEDSALLRRVGAGDTYRSGATRLPAYDPEAPFVQYRLVRQGADSVFVALDAAPLPGEAIYRVRFTRVAAGQGRYVRDAARSASGIAYRFAGPGQGEYEPTRLLPKPRAHTLAGFDARLRLRRGLTLALDGAASTVNGNRFAEGLAERRGGAYVVGLVADTLGSARRGLSGSLVHRQRTTGFTAFDRIRPVDFNARWSVTVGALLPDTLAEATTEASLRGWLGPNVRGTVEAGRLAVADAFDALRAAADVYALARGWTATYRLDASASEDRRVLPVAFGAGGVLADGPRAGASVRGVGRIERSLGRWTPGLSVEHDLRTQRLADTLTSASLAFVDVRPGVRFAAGERASFSLDGVVRRGFVPQGTGLVADVFSLGVQGGYRIATGRGLTAEGRLDVRRRVGEPTAPSGPLLGDAPDAVAMQHDVRYAPSGSLLDVTASYLAQTERTPRLQEVYVRVTPDLPEARYVWTDRNGNGARDLDEFLPETTPYEGTYARTLLPTDSLVAVAGVQTRLRLTLDPARAWREAAGRPAWQRIARRLAARTTLELDDRNADPDPWRLYALDPTRLLRAATTLNGRLRLAQDVFVNRGGRLSADLSASRLRSLSQLASGAEGRSLTTYRADTRWRVATPLSLRLVGTHDRSEAASDRFATRRYRIASSGAEGSASWTPAPGVSVTTGAAFAGKTDRERALTARLWRVPLDVRAAWRGRLLATALVEAALVTLDGDAQGEAAYELTEGRGAGRSALWNVSVQAALSRVLSLTAAYDGRAPQDAPVVQTLRLQLSATF